MNLNFKIFVLIIFITFTGSTSYAQFVTDEKFEMIKNSSISDFIYHSNQFYTITDSCTFIKFNNEFKKTAEIKHECGWTGLFLYKNKILYLKDNELRDVETDSLFFSMEREIPDFLYAWSIFKVEDDLIILYSKTDKKNYHYSLAKKKSMDIPLDSGYSIHNFAKLGGDYIYICKKYNSSNEYLLDIKVCDSENLKIKNNFAKEPVKFSMSTDYFIDGDKIFVLNSNELLLLSKEKVLKRFTLENFEPSISPISFIVLNNIAYIPTEEGLYIKNLINGKVKLEVPENFSKSRLGGFDSIIKWNNYLILTYGNYEVADRDYNKYTIEFYKLN